MQQIDWIRIAPDVAKQLLGEPTKTSSNELRWGSKGSMALNLSEGTFYDHEEGVGGGVIDLIKHLNQDVNTVLKQYGYDLALHSNDSLLSGFDTPKNKTTSNAGSFSREKMVELYKTAEVKLKYSDNFMVLRHANLPMKYAPFSLNDDGTWSMKRPEGKLPIYLNDKGEHKPVILNEGEKALRGCEAIVGDALSSCTWHGGVNSWEKADWSPILKRDVWIFPDNDSAGKECADELSEHLRKKGCRSIKIIKPPKRFNDKDDLYDAYDRGDFKSAEHFIRYANLQKQKLPAGALRFQRADYVIAQVTNPDWLITDVFERNRLITVFGEPKSGKSFIAIAMACAVARGTDFYGHTAKKAPVVYLAGEGLAGVRRRLSAANQYFKKIDPNEKDEGLKDAPLFLSNRGSRINEADEYEKLVDEINLIKEQEKQIGLIIFDTFQRNFSGDENSAQEVNKFVKAADQLIHDFECTVLLVHHTGRGNKGRARGSSVLDASIDGEFLVERKGTKPDDDNSMLVTMKQTKNKDGMGMAEKKFEFHEEHLIGEGLDVTSGLLIETDVDIKSSKEIENDVDIKIAGKMYSLALSIAKKDNCNPEDVYFTYTTFNNDAKGIYHLKNAKDEPYKKYTVDNSLRRMEKLNRVEKNKKGNGYRLVDADFTGSSKDV